MSLPNNDPRGLFVNHTDSRCPGFTLVEVLVTLAIMALIMLALQVTLQSTIFTHDEIAIEMASVREGPRILDRIEKDLQAMHGFNIKDNKLFRGKSERHLSSRADRIDFLTDLSSSHKVRDPLAGQDEDAASISSDVTEVGYRLRPRQDGSEYLELYRREDLYVDEEPLDGGDYELLHDKVSRFEITYLDELGEEAEELEEWDMEEKKKLPAAIVIDLELQSNPALVGDFENTEERARHEYYYRRVVAIEPSMADTMKVRPVFPVFIDPDASKGGGPGGGKDGTGLPGGGGLPGEDGQNGAGGGQGNGYGEGGLKDGGGTLKDRGKGGNSDNRIQFDFDSDGPPEIDPRWDDKISDEDRDLLEEFLDQYRDQYSGGGGFPFGG